MLPLPVQGIAMATFFKAMITLLLDGVPPERIPVGLSAAFPTLRRITAGGFRRPPSCHHGKNRREALHQDLASADATTQFNPALAQAAGSLQPASGFSGFGPPRRH